MQVLRFKISSRLYFDPSKRTLQDADLVRTYLLSCMLELINGYEVIGIGGDDCVCLWLNQALFLFTIKLSFGFCIS